jgi:2-amino-4-hydroxy-6-hydroxymethyldihydropteridine diphosphokinase
VTRVYVAAGSNVDPITNLKRAVATLKSAFPGLVVSGAYANTAVGFDGDDFVNLVVGFDTGASLADVLAVLHAIEAQCGRPREAPKWAPRSMDLDVLLYGDAIGDFPGAKLPRPDLLKRAYMLGPLADIAADVQHPTAGATIGELWSRFDRQGHEMRPVPGFGTATAAAGGQ